MIHYEQTGTGDAVVLLHGGAMDLRMWDDQVPALAERLGEIAVPAVGVLGELDAPDHRAMVERFAAAVAGCRVVRIGGTAHLPNMERPAEFNDALLRFLDQ